MSVGLGPAKGKDFRARPRARTGARHRRRNSRHLRSAHGRSRQRRGLVRLQLRSTIHWKFEQMIAHVSTRRAPAAGRSARLGHRRRRLGRRARHAAAARRRRRARSRTPRHAAQPRRLTREGMSIVAIASINPATGETLRTFDALTDARARRRSSSARRETFRTFRRTPIAERAAALLRAAAILEAEQDALGRLMTIEMGKLAKAGREEAVEVRAGAAASTPSTRARDARRRARRDERGDRELRPLPAARRRPRGHAVELSVLAGLPLRRAGADGRQRRAAQARVERAAVRARDRGHLPPRRLSRRRVPDAADRRPTQVPARARRSARRRR